MKFVLAGLTAAITLACFWGPGATSGAGSELDSRPVENGKLEYDLSIDGPALFFKRQSAARYVLWRVDCALPLRDCVAKSNGLALRIDAKGKAHLFAAKPHGARVSLQMKNYVLDSPKLLSDSLSAAQIVQLAKPKSFVVVESGDQVILRTPTEGIDQVISYLNWMNKPLARTLRDARLWPDFQSRNLSKARMSLESLERLEVLQRRHAAAPNRQSVLVPSTKPQIEFAIGAQNGNSYYSGNGRSGY